MYVIRIFYKLFKIAIINHLVRKSGKNIFTQIGIPNYDGLKKIIINKKIKLYIYNKIKLYI